MKKIILFASGAGSNAENIIRYFNNGELASVIYVFCNRASAHVLERAQQQNVPTLLFTKAELENGTVAGRLRELNPDLIVLAGFLLKVPQAIIEAFPRQIINIHPALLPKYGGKGMYGKHVHTAVLESNESETGISIHYVNAYYDQGDIIFQKEISITECATAEQIAAKIHKLEQVYFPKVIEQLLT